MHSFFKCENWQNSENLTSSGANIHTNSHQFNLTGESTMNTLIYYTVTLITCSLNSECFSDLISPELWWQHPVQALTFLLDVIEPVERDLIPEVINFKTIGNWVIQTACHQTKVVCAISA